MFRCQLSRQLSQQLSRQLSQQLSDENIKNYRLRSRIYRNRRIEDFFKELKLTEGRNTGIPNALYSLDENGSLRHRFEMNEERRFLSVILPINKEFLLKNERETNKILNLS